MKARLASLLLACIVSASSFAAPNAAQPVRFDFQAVTVSQVVQLIYSEVLTTPYVIEPDVLTDARLVSFRYSTDKGDARGFARTFLESLGYTVTTRNGVEFVSKRQDGKAAPEAEAFIYRPLYRDVAHLARLLGPLFKGAFTVNRTVHAPEGARSERSPPDGSAAAMIDQNADLLVFSGEVREVERLRKLLPQVDTAIGEVAVRGVVYEVNNIDRTGSAFGLLANLLHGKLSIGVGSAGASLGSFLQFKGSSVDAIYSLLSSDSRFRVLSSPALRIQSGKRGSFSVGQDVPVLGALSYPQGAGQAVQSVEYRQSGVIFDIAPIVRDAVIELDIRQQLSDFVKTTTGVNNSPTLTKRELRTTVGMADGDVVVLGGLTETKSSKSRDGLSFLPRALHTRGEEETSTEILLVLQVQRIQ